MSFHENLRYYRKKAGYSTQKKVSNILLCINGIVFWD